MATHHFEATALIPAPAEEVFAFVDDHSRFSSHMNRSSWMMGGGRMSTALDEGKGQAIGSHIRMSGRVFGLRFDLDEVVTRRTPPTEKAWETVGSPRLLVIGSYAMGIQISLEAAAARLRVFIDYEPPTHWATYWLGRLFGRMYARWCVWQLLDGAMRHFVANRSATAEPNH